MKHFHPKYWNYIYLNKNIVGKGRFHVELGRIFAFEVFTVKSRLCGLIAKYILRIIETSDNLQKWKKTGRCNEYVNLFTDSSRTGDSYSYGIEKLL
jgi:hypothetical protein